MKHRESLPVHALDERPEAALHAPECLWGIAEIAAFLNVSRRAVERLKCAGRLPRPSIHIGRLPRWKSDTIREWVERGGP